jgi:hypothetical protein
MAHQADAEILQVLGRQASQYPCVDLVLAEGRLVLGEPETPQPFCDIHRPLSRSANYRPNPLERTRIKLISWGRDIRRQQHGNREAAPGATPFKQAVGWGLSADSSHLIKSHRCGICK